jgi:hypothetical protein
MRELACGSRIPLPPRFLPTHASHPPTTLYRLACSEISTQVAALEEQLVREEEASGIQAQGQEVEQFIQSGRAAGLEGWVEQCWGREERN